MNKRNKKWKCPVCAKVLDTWDGVVAVEDGWLVPRSPSHRHTREEVESAFKRFWGLSGREEKEEGEENE